MFESLTSKLTAVFEKFRRQAVLKDDDVDAALRSIRLALLEADVALPVVKSFIQDIREKLIGQNLAHHIQPEQMVIKLIHDELVVLLGADESHALAFSKTTPFSYLMVGLQGSGKTTTTAKLAYYLKKKHNFSSLLVSLDVYRPAAFDQLRILAEQAGVSFFAFDSKDPLVIAKEALKEASRQGIDIIFFDTAGRMHVDDALMKEVSDIHALLRPVETLLVADALMGQDALNIATAFRQALPLTGLIFSRAEGDSRGGAMLSTRSVTQCPIKFLGVGEKLENLEKFDADQIARRILDMGDVVSFVEKTLESLQQEDAVALAKKVEKGQFSLNDFVKQLEQMLAMGGMAGILRFLPGGTAMMKDAVEKSGGDRTIRRQIAIVQSMTRHERRDPSILNASRRRRIAKGAGQTVADVNRLLKQFENIRLMMKKMKSSKFSMTQMGQLFGK